MPLTLRHQTVDEFVDRFRRRFRSAEKVEAARLAAKLIGWVEAGDITQQQVRRAFVFDAAQWTAFRAKAIALRDSYNAVENARGE